MNAAGGRFDWPGLMRLGLAGLRLRPVEFWALTPAELLLLSGRDPGAGPLTRARLKGLMARFPDHPAKAGGTDGPHG